MSLVKPIPDGYHSVQPYMIFMDSAAAIAFYAKAFGAQEILRMNGPEGRIGHAEIRIGDSVIMMADEHPQINAFSAEHYGGSAVGLMLYTEDCDATYKQALAAGATSTREPADQFYGDRMSGVKDPFGYHWWIATHIKDVSMEELKNSNAPG
jgi:PhnB protein